ncbi:MAG: hypothetical protein ACPGEG_06445 [Salibacteraceae bacterium]
MKKSVVAVYDNHAKAVRAVKHLVKNDIPENELSIVGQGQLIEDHIHFVPVKKAKMVIPYIGLAIGAGLGLLAGYGILPLPGFDSIVEAGGFVGMLAGTVFGAVVGALISIVFSLIYRKDDLVVMQKHIDKGKYMLVVKGELADIEKSKKLLHTENIHEEIIDVEG